MRASPRPSLFPYTTLFRSQPLVEPPLDLRPLRGVRVVRHHHDGLAEGGVERGEEAEDVLRALAIEVSRRLVGRSEEHTSELQSRFELVCRLLLDKKNGVAS